MVKKRKKNLSVSLPFGKVKVFSLLIAVLALPLVILMVTNTEQKYESRTQAAVKNDLESIEKQIEKNKKEKKDKENTVLLQQRKEHMKELGYKYPEEFLKKAKTKEQRDNFPDYQKEFIESETELNGEMVTLIFDNFADETSESIHKIKSKDGKDKNVKFSGELTEDFESGATVAFTGIYLDELVVASSDSVSVIYPASVYDLPQYFHVQPVLFTDDTSKRWTNTEIYNALFNPNITNSLNNYYDKMSDGKVDIRGKIHNYVNVGMVKKQVCANNGYSDLDSRAKKLNPDLVGKNAIIYIIAYAPCDWAGLGYIGPPFITWMNDFSLSTFSHEIGHNFGLNHANRINCTNSGCSSSIEYGDHSDTMGINLANLTSFHKVVLGFKSNNIMKTVTSTGTYRVYKSNSANKPKIIRFDIPNNVNDIYVEYRGSRNLFDKDSYLSLARGILVYRWNGKRSSKSHIASFLSNDYYNPVMKDGLTGYISGYKITQISHTSDYATFKIVKK